MTRLYNDPSRFAEDMVTGFAAAHPEHVRAVPGGVVRAVRPPEGKVAVLTGGGSGHYPAFCGVVGPGFADGSVIGDVFTSPSAARAHSVGTAAETGGGVLFLFGNYAGDVMNFGLAADRLTADGVPARCFAVTDDVASAPADDAAKRRGIAGGFVVFKTASAAAEEGASLAEVQRIAAHANARTRTLGVAFDGCTLPGQAEPLFTVRAGALGLGLGVHGEPGVSETELTGADDLARTLAGSVLAERPDGAGPRVAVLLNGLGATKYEELYVLWASVSRLLSEAGLELVRPEVGELVTSLDMAGCSLTVSWLDEELERLWLAPADTPAYRRGTVGAPAPNAAVATAPVPHATARSDRNGTARSHRHAAEGSGPSAADHAALPVPAARSDASAPAEAPAAGAAGGASEVSAYAVRALQAAHDVLHGHQEILGRLDAVAGDGDHGRGMCKGVTGALAAAARSHEERACPAAVLAAAGDAWAAQAGGTSGALWGAALRALGSRLPADRAPVPAELVTAATSALESVTALGGARLGDKTLVDALQPFVTSFGDRVDAGAPLTEAFAGAGEDARSAADATADLRPRLGRARPLADRSIGSPDPGAVSLALVLGALPRT
ncbi:dihydroxyacetone kinase family protein [Streptomyces sp. TS71-3]|uniref:dihydroxyacetone kinase family protein n=1 Tax=Streptomyces sp. TS71-3 TaxID=2733862 RepID=UPI001B07527E|nr:dihydroxyacetone kinase family protein [Streptomyces sp. TS71-3]GHJ37529.1 D-erythrulose kinase [Streptomyces sp. TS71-3]